MGVYGRDAVPEKAFWILQKYRDSGAGGMVLLDVEDKESVKEAIEFLSLASVFPKR